MSTGETDAERRSGRARWRAVGWLLAVIVLVAVAPVLAGDRMRIPYYSQELDWQLCDTPSVDTPGVECADVVVPLDYSDPDGRTLTVVISRVPATDPDRRRGILMSNPGGPGAAGLDSPALLGDVLSPDVLAQYDLIGMDPRGIGASDPAAPCGWPVSEAVRSAGPTPAGFDEEVMFAGELAAACLDGDTEKLRHLTTRNTARDMDLIRAVLGEEKINYFGLSYGTYLGAVFTEMFPRRSDRMVLDSAIDPDRYWTGLVQDWGPADEIAFDDWARWAAARDATYRLGATAPEVRATVDALYQRTAREPIMVDGYPIDDHIFPFILHNLLRGYQVNETLAATVRDIADATAGDTRSSAESGLADLLAALFTGENSELMFVACGDSDAPDDPQWYRRNVDATRVAQPLFGALANNIQPCAFWPPPVEPATVVRNEVPVLIVQATGDPRTPYGGAVQLHRHLSGSRLVTLRDIRIHLTFRPGLSSCVNNAINGYLATGQLPATDITCTPDQPVQ
ncbi:alpha/beta hydrolase [Nocardia speluncae]|uniref:Alpha/beta hydrolase n=1 Tax=Nocardia speluncae TaxID=419477 RepID=A0A846XNN7_9NOCA|nr:alpha/beta hydrolase [Nocardia speluncae]NKY37177.1 alpha/beta hydrolase [Nocardia speluncae]